MPEYINHTGSIAFPITGVSWDAKELASDLSKYKESLISRVLSLNPAIGQLYRPEFVELDNGSPIWVSKAIVQADTQVLKDLSNIVENYIDITKEGHGTPREPARRAGR